MNSRIACMVLGLGAALVFAREDAVGKRLVNAATTFREIMEAPDKGIPQALLDRSQCAIIVPGMKKVAITVGGEYGRGFASCRMVTGTWGPPAGIRLVGGSFGLQLGAQSTDVVMLVMNHTGLSKLLSDKFKIGADAAAAAGPIGRSAAADTDLLMHAEIISWSRSRGVFAGVSLDGTVVEADEKTNEELYGKRLNTKEIIQAAVPIPPAALVLTKVLDQYAPPATAKKG